MSKNVKAMATAPAAKISVFTLAIMNIVAVVSLRGLPSEAEYGLSSIFYYLFAAVVFLIPVSLVAAELATGWPEKGGVFRWVGEAFGPRWAFVAMFMLWIEVTVWFPTGLTFAAVSLAFTGPNQHWDQALSANNMFVLAIILSIYWLATFIAFRGVGAFATVSKWGGIVGTIIPAIVLIVLGFAYLLSGGHSQINLVWKDVIPDFTNFNNVVLAAGIFLFYAGMEMNAIHVKDVSNPTRNFPIAILISSIGTVAIFVLGTLAIAFIIPHASINLTQSLLVAYFDMFKWAHIHMACSGHGGRSRDRRLCRHCHLGVRAVVGPARGREGRIYAALLAAHQQTRNGHSYFAGSGDAGDGFVGHVRRAPDGPGGVPDP